MTARRIIRAVLVTAVLAVGLVLVPVPRLVWATEMSTEATNPVPGPVGEAFVDPATVPDFGDDHGDGATAAGATQAADRSIVLDEDAGAFTTIGIGWAGDVVPSDVIVRTRSNGAWDGWHHLTFSADHRPDDEAAAAAIAEPFWVGTADAYEIQYPASLGEPTVYLVRETESLVGLAAEEPVAGADPVIRPRSAWGARAPKVTPSTSATLEMAIVHHSVSSNNYSSGQVPGILRSIQAYHMDARGWDDIAYNFAVDRFGQIWEARAGGIDRPVIGGHAYGFNVGTTGVVALGEYGSVTPTSAMTTAISDVIAWKFAEHHVPSSGTVTMYPGISTHHGPEGTPVTLNRISGHRNTGQTSCPGNQLYDRLPSIRSAVNARIGGHQQSAPPILIGGERTGDGRDDALVYHPGSRADIDFLGASGPTLSPVSTRVTGLYEPLAGDFDRDGISDVFWYRPGPSADYLWYGTSGGGHRDATTNIYGDYIARVGDFDGDGADDILWYGDYRTSDAVFWGGPGGFTSTSITVDDHVTPLIGDYDGDGADDILWYGWRSRPDHLTWGRTNRALTLAPTAVNGAYEPFVGDFDGNRADDIFWYGPGPAADGIWSGNGSRSFGASATSVSGLYEPSVGDFDGNGRDDIMWYAAGPSPDYLWFQDAGGRRSVSQPVNGAYQTLVLDADANERDELLWVSDTDVSYLWSRTANGTLQSKRVN